MTYWGRTRRRRRTTAETALDADGIGPSPGASVPVPPYASVTVMVPDMLDPTEEMETLCVRIARDLHEVRGWIQAQH